MIFSENRCPPRIKSGAGFFGIMLYRSTSAMRLLYQFMNSEVTRLMVR